MVNCDKIAINFNGDEEKVLFEKFVFRVYIYITFVTTPQHQKRLKARHIYNSVYSVLFYIENLYRIIIKCSS